MIDKVKAMLDGAHGRNHVRAWRSYAAEHGWPLWQCAQAIARCCATAPLKAHRLARGWTLAEAVDRMAGVLEDANVEPVHVTVKLLSRWESGEDRPRPAALDALCRLYATRPDRLGFGTDYGEPDFPRSAEPEMTEHDAIRAPEPWLFTDPSTAAALHGLLSSADRVRAAADRALSSSTVSHERLDLYSDTFQWRRREYCTTSPITMLATLLSECHEIQELAAGHQPAAIQRRLSELTAFYSTLIADALMKLGERRGALSWYATATIAADDTGDGVVRALVRAQAAMLPYYYGNLTDAVRLAHEAQLLTRGRACSSLALAAAAEARALAKLGHDDAAEAALRRCQETFDQLNEPDEELAFRFTERRLMLYLSGALTNMRQTRRAAEIQEAALERYRGEDGIDPVLIRLDQAICMAISGQVTDGCQLAEATLAAATPDQRTGVVLARTADFISAVPERQRVSRPVRQLAASLALPPSR